MFIEKKLRSEKEGGCENIVKDGQRYSQLLSMYSNVAYINI